MKNITNAIRQKISEKWPKAMRESSEDWVKYRLFFWVFAGVAITVLTYLLARVSSERPSLAEQLIVFGLLGVFFGWFGFLLGLHNPDKKRHWSAADVVWVTLALWGLLKTLQPIDDHMRDGELQNEVAAVSRNFRTLYRGVAELEKTHCFGKAEVLAGCEQIYDIRNELVMRPASDEFDNIDHALGVLNRQTGVDAGQIGERWGRYKEAVLTQEASVRKGRKGDTYLIAQYVYMGALIFAFGLRMARAGADWRNAAKTK